MALVARIAIVSVLLACGCGEEAGSKHDAGGAGLSCPGDAYLRLVATFPSGEPLDTGCMALQDGVSIAYDGSTLTCEAVAGRASVREPTYVIVDTHGNWSTIGPIAEWSGITLGLSGTRCTDPMAAACYFNAAPPRRCELEVMAAGTFPGDIVEARLRSPCELWGDSAGGLGPTVTALRFRGVAIGTMATDAGTCWIDGGR